MWKFKVSKISIVLVGIALVVFLGAWFSIRQLRLQNQIGPNDDIQPFLKSQVNSQHISTAAPTAQPEVFSLKVPFTPQAPTGNWDQLHEESCEEAAAIMANAYFSGRTEAILPPDYVEQWLSDLISWEQKSFGYDSDTTSQQTAEMISSVYGLKTNLIQDFSAEDLKRELLAGHVVIISEAGRLLGNPNYKRPGPVHHMLVIRGYTPQGFVTNDSGTHRGENYFYSFETLRTAAADWNLNTGNVDQSQKVAIVVWK